MNNKGKSRKRAAKTKLPSNTDNESAPIVDDSTLSVDESKKTEILKSEELIKKRKKRPANLPVIEEENDVPETTDENCEATAQNEVSDFDQPPRKQVKRAKIGKKNQMEEVEKISSFEDSSTPPSEGSDDGVKSEQKDKFEAAAEPNLNSNKRIKKSRVQKPKDEQAKIDKKDEDMSASPTPQEGNDTNVKNEQKGKFEGVAEPDKSSTKMSKRNRAQKPKDEQAKNDKKNPTVQIEKMNFKDSGSSLALLEENDVKDEQKDKFEAVAELDKNSNKTSKKTRVQKSKMTSTEVIKEETSDLPQTKKRTRQTKNTEKPEKKTKLDDGKKPVTKNKKLTKATREDKKSEHEKSDDSNSKEETKPANKATKQKKNKKLEKQESDANMNKQTQDLETDDVSPDDDFEIKKPITKKVTKPKKATPSSNKEEKAPKPPNKSILQLKISLRDITPPIFRRIQVLNNSTFFDLRNNINEAMGWISDRSHQFIVSNPKTNSNILIVNGTLEGLVYDFTERHLLKEETTKLSRFLSAKDDRLLYEFDLGDSWVHEVIVEKILPPPPPKAEYPKCTGGKRACPPEDCGGVDGYNHLVEVYKNPSHKEYEELITDWLGEYNPGWDPEKFDKKKVFRKVRMWVWAPAGL
ncbi:transcriptional regulator ATRX homolog isoform X2 [Zophobas morio]|uniref:transcriptional regulator ATRX homolog isoform X2 n=1 Tax=Zophobas morio TaxID=2755281 RepID=UPI003083BD3D